MKKIYLLLLFCIAAGVVGAQNVKEVFILHTNDMHSRIEPFHKDYADTLLAGKAGMLRRANFVAAQRKEHIIKNFL